MMFMNNPGEDKDLWQDSDADQTFANENDARETTDDTSADADYTANQREHNPDDLTKDAKTFATDEQTTEDDFAKTNPPQVGHFVPIRWTASEAIEHTRGKNWYIAAVAVAVLLVLALAALDIFKIMDLMSAITTGALVVIILVAVIMVAKKPPRDIDYILTENGLTIAGQLHPFSEFRAFGVRKIGALWQLVLLPVKRFGMGVTLFIHEDQGEDIVDTLGAILPMEDVKTDLVDNISRKLKI